MTKPNAFGMNVYPSTVAKSRLGSDGLTDVLMSSQYIPLIQQSKGD